MRKNEITTERLTLHPFAECDEQRMLEIFCNEQIKQTYMIPDFQDMEQSKALFRRMMELSKSDEHFTYGIYLGEKLIGFVNDCEMSDSAIELGYVIRPEYQGKGYATEAVRACIDELFRMGIKKVTAGFFEENHASRRVMEKCGMHRIEQEDDIEYRGIAHHCLYYGIDAPRLVYHMSDTLPLNTVMTADYKETMELVMPSLQALERSEDCFFAMLMAAKHQKAVLKKFGLQDMWTNYIKWATEAIFEYVRRNEYPDMPCRITGHYFFDNLESVMELYRVDWAVASEEERAKIRLYEVDLEDECPARLDMRLFDEAFDAMWERENVQTALRCARSYFSGQPGENPIWELLSEGKAIAKADISDRLTK